MQSAPQNIIGKAQQLLTRFLAPIASSNLFGSQRSIVRQFYSSSGSTSLFQRSYDLEITESPIREHDLAKDLIEMREWCPEHGTALSIFSDDVTSSMDGDDQGFAVPELMNDGTPINPELRIIAEELFDRVLNSTELKPIIENMISYGDNFTSIAIDRGDTRGELTITGLLNLPVWEMFRVETNQGQLLGFEQRRRINQEKAEYTFTAANMIHFRRRRRFLYGQSIWQQSRKDWYGLKQSESYWDTAVRSLGINPNVHIMPEGTKPNYLKEYKQDYEAQRAKTIATDFYMLPGGDVRKLANQNPNLDPIANKVMMHRKRMIMPTCIPIWRFAGFEESSGQDNSTAPSQKAIAYARTINGIRGDLVTGISQLLKMELILRKGEQWFRENGKFRIAFPKFQVSVIGNVEVDLAENTDTGINDLD